MSDDSTLLTPAADNVPPAGKEPDAHADPKADPKGSAAAPEPPAPPKPDGPSPDPIKAPEPSTPPAASKDPKPDAPAPWSYADLKTPEGIAIDPALGEKLNAIGQELHLSQDAAQKLVDLQSELSQKTAADASAQWRSMKDSWRQETVKELGAEAEKQLAYAAAFLSKYGDAELQQLLDDTGTGNHRALIRCLIKAGRAMSEDPVTEGKTRSPNEGKTPAEILYPSATK